jgi:hypothetical protein
MIEDKSVFPVKLRPAGATFAWAGVQVNAGFYFTSHFFAPSASFAPSRWVLNQQD